jgi:hypothetical protein
MKWTVALDDRAFVVTAVKVFRFNEWYSRLSHDSEGTAVCCWRCSLQPGMTSVATSLADCCWCEILLHISLFQVTYRYITFSTCKPSNYIPTHYDFLICRLGTIHVVYLDWMYNSIWHYLLHSSHLYCLFQCMLTRHTTDFSCPWPIDAWVGPVPILNGLNGHINRLSLHPNFVWLLPSTQQYGFKHEASSINFHASSAMDAWITSRTVLFPSMCRAVWPHKPQYVPQVSVTDIRHLSALPFLVTFVGYMLHCGSHTWFKGCSSHKQTTWLMIQLPPLFPYCAHHSQFSQVTYICLSLSEVDSFCIFKNETSINHLMYFMLPKVSILLKIHFPAF